MGFPHIVSDFEQIFLEQQVPKSNFRSKLTRFTLYLFILMNTRVYLCILIVYLCYLCILLRILMYTCVYYTRYTVNSSELCIAFVCGYRVYQYTGEVYSAYNWS